MRQFNKKTVALWAMGLIAILTISFSVPLWNQATNTTVPSNQSIQKEPEVWSPTPNNNPQDNTSLVARINACRTSQWSRSIPSQQPLPLTNTLTNQASLQAIIASTAETQPGFWAIYVRDLGTGETAEINADTQLNVASLYKLQVLYTTYALEREGELSLDEVLPEGWTVSSALYDMITVSDQGATFALLRRIGTDTVNSAMASLGLTQSYITDWGYSTARETGALLEMIAVGDAVDSSASQEMLALLFDQQINDRLPAYLPAGTVAHKTGELSGTRNDAGIVFGPNSTYVIVVATSGLPNEDDGAAAIAELSREVYAYFNE